MNCGSLVNSIYFLNRSFVFELCLFDLQVAPDQLAPIKLGVASIVSRLFLIAPFGSELPVLLLRLHPLFIFVDSDYDRSEISLNKVIWGVCSGQLLN